MKNLQKAVFFMATTLISSNSIAGVYKCTDDLGNTAYQAKPCTKSVNGMEINMKTGNLRDLSYKQKEKEAALALKRQQEAELQKKQQQEAQRLRNAAEQSAKNQQLVKNNPIQFSAFAIPPYKADKLTPLVKMFDTRLPEIEKLRRLAAQKALASGQCIRVESDELSKKSTHSQLVFSVDCSTAKTFFYNEKELLNGAN